MCEKFPEGMSVEDVFDRYADTVYRLAYARTKNKYDAEDVLQTVFLRLVRADTVFTDGEHLKAWLIRVTVNVSKNLLSSAWMRLTDPMPEALCDEPQDVSEVFFAVRKLPLKYRTVIHLFYYEDYSCARIGQILGVKEATVRTRLKRGRERLAAELKGEEPDV